MCNCLLAVAAWLMLGRPSLSESIYLTMAAEYGGYAYREDVRAFGREAIARNLYQACGDNGCQGYEPFTFLSAYEPWLWRTSALRNVPEIPELRDDVKWVLAWHNGGVEWDRPWAWFGPFEPSQKCRNNVEPSIVVDTVWFLTADEVIKFKEFCR